MSEVSPEVPKSKPEAVPKENSNTMSSRIEALTIQEDAKEGEAEDEEGLPIFPYERLKVTSTDLVTGIDVTKREVIKYNVPFYIGFIILIIFVKDLRFIGQWQTYLSSGEFREKFGMTKDAFYKLPKWKQNKHKMALQLF